MDDYIAIVDAIRKAALELPPAVVTIRKTSGSTYFYVRDETNRPLGERLTDDDD